MKKLILIAGAAALASCGGGADEVTVDNDVTLDTPETAEVTRTTMSDYAGTHKVYDADGNLLGTTVAVADGTYTDTDSEGATASGTWELNGSGQLCFDPDGNEGATCWTKGGSVDGREAWSDPDGQTVFVEFTS